MPDALGHHKLLNLVGIGRMGELYRARDMHAGRTVALRVVADEIESDPGQREPFLRDAGAAATLSHPNIAALYEVGDDQGHLFLVSEFVPGETLKTVIAGRALNPRDALDYTIQLADALAEGHAAGMVYGDLRPANIIVTPKGKAKLLDFGLAMWTRGGAERAQALASLSIEAGAGLEAVPYMSPEQFSREPIDARTDIFSLGIVLFEMLTGRLPFNAPTAAALAAEIRQTPAPAPSLINPALPVALDAVLLKMLDKTPGQRHDIVAMVAADLRSVAAAFDAGASPGAATASAGPVKAPSPAQTPRQPRKPAVRPQNRPKAFPIWIVLAVAAVIAALLLFATGFGERWLGSLLRAWQQDPGRGGELLPVGWNVRV